MSEKIVLDHAVVVDPDRVKKEKARKAKDAMTKRDSFRKWLKTDHSSGYRFYVPFGPTVIVRLFLFKPDKKNSPKIYTSLDDDGTGLEMVESQVLPLAKILSVGTMRAEGYENIDVDDICTIQEDVLGLEVNPKWVQWQKDIREQPSLERDVASPPKYKPKLTQWSKYVFTKDKFSEPELETDGYTFLIPQTFLKTMFNHTEYINKYK